MESRRTGFVPVVLGLALSLAWWSTPATAVEGPSDRPVAVVAHAGGLAAAPQNTVAAVRTAIRHGADVIENDFQVTADDKLVVLHNTSLAATTNVEEVFPDRAPWNVGDFTLAEIRQLDAGSWFSPGFAGERVPTLREWAKAVGDDARMLIEAKTPELYPGMETLVARELATRPVFLRALRQDRLVVMSFNHPWLRALHDLAPDVPVGMIFSYYPTPAELRVAARWVEYAVPAISVVDEATVQLMRRLGMRVDIWTVNTPAEVRLAVRWGADGVITDVPRAVHQVLRRMRVPG